jgi:hypothetical protein
MREVLQKLYQIIAAIPFFCKKSATANRGLVMKSAGLITKTWKFFFSPHRFWKLCNLSTSSRIKNLKIFPPANVQFKIIQLNGVIFEKNCLNWCRGFGGDLKVSAVTIYHIGIIPLGCYQINYKKFFQDAVNLKFIDWDGKPWGR